MSRKPTKTDACVLCGSVNDLVRWNGRTICKACHYGMEELMPRAKTTDLAMKAFAEVRDEMKEKWDAIKAMPSPFKNAGITAREYDDDTRTYQELEDWILDPGYIAVWMPDWEDILTQLPPPTQN